MDRGSAGDRLRAVVDCGHRQADTALYDTALYDTALAGTALAGQGPPGVPRAGDCVAPRTTAEAVLEGRRRALDIGAPDTSAPDTSAPDTGAPDTGAPDIAGPGARAERGLRELSPVSTGPASTGPASTGPASTGPASTGPASTGGRYKHVFTPLRLGPVTIANRIVFTAHLTNYAEDGLPTRQHAEYYAARPAAGGPDHHRGALHPPDRLALREADPRLPPGRDPRLPAHHRRGPRTQHPDLRPDQPQRRAGLGMYTRLPVWAPSPVADPLFREVPKEVDEREIAEIIDGYALVAEHCAAAGSTGSSCSARTVSIVRGFLSPATNVRTDRWGGSLATAPGCCWRLVAAVRDAIGRDMALGVRLCGDELIEGGTTIDEAVEVAKLVEATGHVDYLNTSIGVATQTLYMIEASMAVPPATRCSSRRPRRAARLPVVGVGPVQGRAAGRPGDRRGPVRHGRRGARPDRRPGLRPQVAFRARRGRPAVPVVQPGMRRADGAEPVAGLHRGPARRT